MTKKRVHKPDLRRLRLCVDCNRSAAQVAWEQTTDRRFKRDICDECYAAAQIKAKRIVPLSVRHDNGFTIYTLPPANSAGVYITEFKYCNTAIGGRAL